MVEAAGVEPASEIVVNKERLHAQPCSAYFALRAQNRQDARIASPWISPEDPYPALKTSLLCDVPLQPTGKATGDGNLIN